MKRGGQWLALSILSIITLGLATIAGPLCQTAQATPDNNQSFTVLRQLADEDDNNANPPSSTDENNQNNDATDEQTDEDSQATCEESLFGIGWIICPGQNLITTVIGWFLGFIDDTMNWTLLASNSNDIVPIWQDFVNIANIVFAIAFLILIYSMATSTGLSNYSVKKLLPRLIVVAVIVNTSFYICAALVDLSNIAGKGAYALMTSRMSGSNFINLLPNLLTSTVGFAGAAVATVVFGGTMLIAIAIILLAVAFRQLALLVLVIISPVAFALYILPNTEKLAKKWTDTFVRMLAVYPLFMAIWGASQLVSNIAAQTTEGIIPFILSVVCAVVPAIAILPLFKATGGLMGKVTGAMQNHDVAKKGAKAINKTTRDTTPARQARLLASQAALNAQNRYGDTRVVGSLMRRPGFNKLVNNAQDYQATIDKDALASATNWAKELDSSQLSSLVTTGSYQDNRGQSHRILDTYKLRAAADLAKDGMGASDWYQAMKIYQVRADELKAMGRRGEAKHLLRSLANAETASKSAVIKGGGISSFGDGQWNSSNFDAKYAMSAAQFARDLSPEKLAKLPSGAQNHLQSAIKMGITNYANSVSAGNDQNHQEEVSTLNGAVQNLQQKADAVLKSDKLKEGLDNSSKASLRQERRGIRTVDQERVAQRLQLDKAYDYFTAKSDSDPLANDKQNEARRFIREDVYDRRDHISDYQDLSGQDKKNIEIIAGVASSDKDQDPKEPPEPVQTWKLS